ncbi:MAG TPA: protein kinase, partial [Polyangiaceae bacterium LLY-WYZ-15_(1-7)]|nr:protein kinase [Polyangiaceae bacterium LLY-WYZ-15_(1-7)]
PTPPRPTAPRPTAAPPGRRPLEPRVTAAPPRRRGAAPPAAAVPPAPAIPAPPSGSAALPPDPAGRLSDADAEELPVLGRFGPYDILGRLALGGMAEILLARPHGSQRRPVVVKKILAHFAHDEDFVDMFLDEARIGLLLDHPNIVRFTDQGEVRGQHYIEMEWVDGVPLGRVIRRARKHGGVPPRLAAAIIARTADALHHAHTLRDEDGRFAGLIHRDVSPHNIMVGYDGEVKLLDFGIAKADMQQHHTQAGVVKGKFAYMAPEQCHSKSAIDHRVDLWALGVVLVETLTGKSLYRRDSEAETMRAVIDDPVPRLRDRMADAPPALEGVVQNALAKEPDARFRTAAQMRDALQGYLDRSGGPVQRPEIEAFMRRCFAADIQRGPSVDSTPFGSSYVAQVDAEGRITAPDRAAPRPPSGARELDFDLAEPLEGLDEGLGELPPAPEGLPDLPGPLGGDVGPVAGFADGGGLAERSPPGAAAGPGAPTPAAPARPRPRRPAPAPAAKGGGGPWLLVGGVVLALGLVGGGVFLWKPWESSPPPTEAAPTPAVDEGAAILVASVPPGATVSLDGEARGPTPLELGELEAGTYTVRVEAPDHAPWEQQVSVEAGQVEALTARLEESVRIDFEGADGRLTLDTDPPTRVFVGDRDLGVTPLRGVIVPSGTLPLILELPGGDRRRTSVLVRGGGEETRVHLNASELR